MPQIDRGKPQARMALLPRSLRLRFAKDEMRQRNENLIEVRQKCLSYVRPLSATQSSNKPDIIWQYWDQGECAAPPIIAACLASVRKNCTNCEVRVLDANSIGRYINLPSFLKTKEISKPHLSDLIRLKLLANYGGTWLDASIFLTSPIPEVIQRASFFCYTRPCDPFLLSSWLISSRPAHPLVMTWHTALFDYWRTHDSIIDYFLMHHIFESHVTWDKSFRKIWESVPYLDSHKAHKLQGVLTEPFFAEKFSNICSETPVHKLTYKYHTPEEPNTFSEYIINRFIT